MSEIDDILNEFKKLFPEKFQEHQVDRLTRCRELIIIAQDCGCICHYSLARHIVPCCQAAHKFIQDLEIEILKLEQETIPEKEVIDERPQTD